MGKKRQHTDRRITPVLLLCLAAHMPLHAQKTWTLEQCCNYAVEHNIGLRQKDNQRRQQEIQLSNARNQRLPDLSASIGENLSYGRGLTAENTYTNTNTSNTSFSLGTSVPLFTGFQIPNQIRLNRLNLEAAMQDMEKARNDIRMQVAQGYVQVLYDMELLDVAHRQVGIDSAQVDRLEKLLAVGKASEAQVSQQRAAMAQSRLTATQANNNLQLALLSLSQLLELDSPEEFAIARVENVEQALHATTLNPALVEEVLADALAVKPEIRSGQMKLQAAERSIDIARAGLYPTLSFSAGMGTNYYTRSGAEAAPFGRQLKNNFSQYLGMNLSVPIFRRFQTRNSIRTAKIERENKLLELDNTKKTLRKEIQQVFYNAVAAQEKVASCQQACQASEDAFRLTKAKYEQGKSTVTEFNEAKNNLMKTVSDLTQARYECIYQLALIKFYRGQQLAF